MATTVCRTEIIIIINLGIYLVTLIETFNHTFLRYGMKKHVQYNHTTKSRGAEKFCGLSEYIYILYVLYLNIIWIYFDCD